MTLALTGLGRVFVNASGRNAGSRYKYHSCMKIDGIDKSLGDVTPIYCPDPDRYDEFIEVATIKGADGRATSTLTGYLPMDSVGALEEIYNQKCGFDMQVHYGQCARPNDFNQYASAIILRDVKLTSYAWTPLTARTPDERASIDETAAISIGDFYRIYPVSEAIVKPSQITGTSFVFGIVNVSVQSCGDNCTDKDDGNQTWIGGQITAADNLMFLVTRDNGSSWVAVNGRTSILHNTREDIAKMTVADGYIYTIMNQSSVTTVLKTSINSILNNFADTVTIATIPAAFYFAIDTSDNYLWLAGYYLNQFVVTWIHKSTFAMNSHYKSDSEYPTALYAYSDDNVVVAGLGSSVYYSTVRGIFNKITTEPGTTIAGFDVHMFSESKWLLGFDDGIYYTTNAGATWTKVLTTTGWVKFAFYDDITGYAVTDTGTYRTLDSGTTWTKVSTNLSTSLVSQAVVSPANPNLYWAAVGISSNSHFRKGTS